MSDLMSDVLGQSKDDIGQYGSDHVKIVTVGAGGAGCNMVNRLVKAGVKGTEFIGVNTDAQQFKIIDDRVKKVLIGKSITKGLGAGGEPAVGQRAAEADRQLIEQELATAQLVFLCVGEGGGTGTGSAPVIAQIAKEQGAIVVAMATYPFNLERVRKVKAEEGIQKLRKHCDSVILLDNNRLVQLAPNLPMDQAFGLADEILAKAIGGLVWTITQPSLITIDFADVRSIMGNGDVGFISVGTGKGNDKVAAAADGVLKNRLLDVSFEGASGALIHITGGSSLSIGDAISAGDMITDQMDPKANVKWGARIIQGYEDKIEIVAIVTGVKGASIVGRLEEKSSNAPYNDLELIG
ncbi:MAG: cell division protein FtsZ [Candidatus Marsarchaeota archaeon]|nr:cell division protein FtsZ [Candidatus Marsarchaeota archaeon]MCL5112687.1 cell division protein FtsZ [Candidatus Marsarchaeota archaeon]